LSSNPLRRGEPLVAWGTEVRALGTRDNVVKVIEHLAMSMDRVEVLISALVRLGDINDFAKRTIASHAVLELHAAFKMVVQDRRIHLGLPRPIPNDLTAIEKQIRRLLKPETPFSKLRNKLVAHLDGDLDALTTRDLWFQITRRNVAQWLKLLESYIHALWPHLPFAAQPTLQLRNEPAHNVEPVPSVDYVPYE
jgi:hypothetical protein